MTEEPDWIKNLIDPQDVAEIQSTAERIVEAHGTFYEMTVMMSQEDMIEAVRAGHGMQIADHDSWVIGVAILMALMDTMKEALEKDGINIWEE
jgi:uncharacterized FAD-dependent dehydrogenase